MVEVLRFDADEAGYLQWMVDHPAGYVVNTKRDEAAATAMLHRSGCAHIRIIRNQGTPGAFTQRGGIKFCSLDIRSLLLMLGTEKSARLLKVVSCRSCSALPMDLEVDARGWAQGTAHGVAWERDPLVRAFCIRYHGTRCQVCQIDLAQRYGPIGASATEVHLLHPQMFKDASVAPDPVEDLIPVCPSCHVMLHIGRSEPMPLEDLRRWMTRARVLWHEHHQ